MVVEALGCLEPRGVSPETRLALLARVEPRRVPEPPWPTALVSAEAKRPPER